MVGLLVAVVIAIALLPFLAGRNPPPTPLPNPNGYDDFITAGGLIVEAKLADFRTLGHQTLRAFVETNAEPLRLLRVGLTRRSAVPMDAAITNFSNIMSDLARLKKLAWLLSAEGRLRELDQQFGDAARSYVDTVGLGAELSHGGLMIHRLVGLAGEAIGRQKLSMLLPILSCEQIRPLIADLDGIDGNGVTWEEVVRNERRWAGHQKFPLSPWSLWSWWQARGSRRGVEEKHEFAAAGLRLLIVEIALRCYESEEGHSPARLEGLVPKYLQRIPSDPFGGSPLIYRQQGTNHLLYSVGPDRVDDGGTPMVRAAAGNAAASAPAPPRGDVFHDSSR